MRPAHTVMAICVAIIWGIAFVFIDIALESFSPSQLTALRFILAALPVLFIRRPDISWRLLIVLGMFLFVGQFMMLFFAYKVGMPAGLAAVTTHSQALFTILLAAMVMREMPSRRQWFGVATAFAGLALVAASIGGELTALGLALVLGGAFSWAIGNIILKRLGRVDMLALMVWLSLVPPLPALAASALFGDEPGLIGALQAASMPSLLSVLFLGLISTAVAYAVWGRLLNTYPAVMVTPFALFAPCAGIIGAYLILDETFGLLRGSGMALIVLGIAITVLRGRALPGR